MRVPVNVGDALLTVRRCSGELAVQGALRVARDLARLAGLQNGDVKCMDVVAAFGDMESEIKSLPHVVSVAVSHRAPSDYRVVVAMDDWDWGVWQHIHDHVDNVARAHVREATLTAEIAVVTSRVHDSAQVTEAAWA